MPKVVDTQERRRAVASAALGLAAREGLGAVTVGRVATAAGISKGAVQHWFPTKQDLLLAASLLLGERLDDRVRAAVTAERDPREQLVALASALVPADEAGRLDAAAGHALFAVVLEDGPARRLVVEGRRAAVTGVAALIAEVAPGTVDADRAATLLLAAAGDLADAVLLGELTPVQGRAQARVVVEEVLRTPPRPARPGR